MYVQCWIAGKSNIVLAFVGLFTVLDSDLAMELILCTSLVSQWKCTTIQTGTHSSRVRSAESAGKTKDLGSWLFKFDGFNVFKICH